MPAPIPSRMPQSWEKLVTVSGPDLWWDNLIPVEKWIVYYLKEGKTQEQIASLLKLTQPTVSYRVRRISKKLDFWNRFIPIRRENIEEKMSTSPLVKKFGAELTDWIYEYLRIGNQAEVGKKFACSQGRVRYRLLLVRDFLQETFGDEDELLLALNQRMMPLGGISQLGQKKKEQYEHEVIEDPPMQWTRL